MLARSSRVAGKEEGIKEEKKKGLEALLFINATLFIRSSTLSLPLKALLLFISFNLSVIGSPYSFVLEPYSLRVITFIFFILTMIHIWSVLWQVEPLLTILSMIFPFSSVITASLENVN